MLFVVAVNALFLVFLVLKPCNHRTIVFVDDAGTTAGIWIAACGGFAALVRAANGRRLRQACGVSSLFLTLGITAFAVGEAFWSYYELVLHRETPFPSLADVGYLLTYPFLLAGILTIPCRPLTRIRRIRIVFDGLILLGSLCTFSWYFVIGPKLLAGSESALAKVFGTAYPIGDLLLLYCLFVLWSRSRQTFQRSAATLLVLGILCFVAADSAFCYLTLHGQYQTGCLFDVGWPLGFMLVGYAAHLLTCVDPAETASARKEPTISLPPATARQPAISRLTVGSRNLEAPPSVGNLLFPYFPVVLSWGLLVYTRLCSTDWSLERGVYLGAAVVALSVLFRQILAILENDSLNRALRTALTDLEEKTAHLDTANRELEAANYRLRNLATTDGLTGMLNHRTFHERLQEEYERCARHTRPLSLTLLDVDRFKQYNDVCGHPAGDLVLRRVAAILREHARGADIVARYGGEEFAVIMPETDHDGARHAAERLRAAVESAEWPEREITVSVGISTLDNGAPTAAELIAAADLALYRSKRTGRNRVTHIQDSTHELQGGLGVSYSQLIEELTNAEHGEIISAFERIRDILSESYDVTVESWSHLLELRDKETEGHSERVTTMTVALAKRIGMNPEEVMYVRWGSLLHDIGKVGVPDDILRKDGALTDEEWTVMRTHTTVARDMLWPVAFLRPALDIPYCHHEKWNGTGYPRGLAGDEIPLAARLFAVVDVWDALSHDRPYRSAWSQPRVRTYLVEESGKHFDPRAVKVFLEMLEEQEEGRPGLLATAAEAA